MFLVVFVLCCHRERGEEGSDVGVVGGQSVVCRQGTTGEGGEGLPGRMLTSRRSSRRIVMTDSRNGNFGVAAAAAAGAAGVTPMVLRPVTKLLSEETVASFRLRGLVGDAVFSPSRYENLLTATV